MFPILSVLTSCFRGKEFLPDFFSNVETQTIFPNLELVLVLNEPDLEELALAEDFESRHPNQIQIIRVNPVEGLYASWNRGWLAANGKYIAAWNVDDQRVKDSLERQINALEKNPHCSLCYGDFIIVGRYGDVEGTRVLTPAFAKKKFLRTFYSGGSHLVWKNSVKSIVGLFDEQLKISGDYDFFSRCLLIGETFCRAEGILGYYTDSNKGLSTRDFFSSTLVEETLIRMRYGNYDKAKRQYLPMIEKYRVDSANYLGGWHKLADLFPAYQSVMKSYWYRKIIGILVDPFRQLLFKYGVWEKAIQIKMNLEKRTTRKY